MSKTLDQIFIANPITSNANTDLMYFVQSPYTVGTDAAMTYANFAAQFQAPLSLPLSLAQGGTNANLTASANGLVYSGASAFAILATANNGVLITSNTGVPSISSTLPTAVQGNITQLGTQSQALNMGNNAINNLTDPVNAQDAATKNYVNNVAAGLNPVDGVYAASTANLTSWTYLNGASGVGATLTAPSNGVFTVDGVSPPVGSRFLYKNDTTYTGTANGIYTVTTSTSGSPAVLTRATDYNTPSQISVGDLISVEFGTANATSSWYQTATVVTIGTSAITFSVWFNPASYVSSALTSGHIFVGNGSNIAAGVAVSGDATLSNTGALTVASIGGEAVSLGGSFTMSGAHTFSGTLTGNTSVTFPTSGTLATTGSIFSSINIQTFTSTGTYTPTAGMIYCIAEGVGQGGGGGGVASSSGGGAGGGGGAGSYARVFLTAAQVGSSLAVTIANTGGAGGTAGNNNGTAGSNVTLGSLLQANGGSGGIGAAANSSAKGGAGGTVGTGTFTSVGMGGSGSNGGTITTVSYIPGRGGSTAFGGPGAGNNLNAGGAGTGAAAVGYGGGGDGGGSFNGSAAAAGGQGSGGLIIVTEFI